MLTTLAAGDCPIGTIEVLGRAQRRSKARDEWTWNGKTVEKEQSTRTPPKK